MKRKEITNLEDAKKYVEYKMWFTDSVIKKYLPSLEKAYSGGGKKEKEGIIEEAKMHVLNYAFLVYYIYPNSEKFKNEINSSKELSKNFASIQKWLDDNKVKKYADNLLEDAVVSKMESAFGV